MAFSDARNQTPAQIGIETARYAVGPNTATAQAVKGFGDVVGGAWEGVVTGQMHNELNAVGNEIAALNSPLVEQAVTPGGAPAGVSINRADPTGTVDQTTTRFKALAAAREQGLISQQRAKLEADTVLREAITRAPGFADNLRKAAGDWLGFNPSGAALEQLYLSGPDLTKSVPKSQTEKDWETATNMYQAGQVASPQDGFILIQTAKKSEYDKNILEAQTKAGTAAAPVVINGASMSFGESAKGIVYQAMDEINKIGGVQDPQRYAAQLSLEAEKTKQSFRANMSSGDIKYSSQDITDMETAVNNQLKTYTDIVNNNDFVKVLKDHRDEVMAVAQMAGVDLAPDLYALYFTGGQAAVDAYLKVMKLANGDPKALAELRQHDGMIDKMAGLSDNLKDVSKSMRAMFEGNIGSAVRYGFIDPKAAKGTILTAGQLAINNHDPAAAAAAGGSALQVGMPSAGLSTLAQTPGWFKVANDETKQAVKKAFPGTVEQSKQQLAQGLANSNFALTYNPDSNRYEVVSKTPVANNAVVQGAQTLFTDFGVLQIGGGAPIVPANAVAPPDVANQLDVLNHQIQPMVNQPDVNNFIYGTDAKDPNDFINNYLNEVNLRAAQIQLMGQNGGEAGTTIGLPVEQQVKVSKALADALQTGDRTELDKVLQEVGLPPIAAPAQVKASIATQPDQNSGFIERTPQLMNMGMGTFVTPTSVSGDTARVINTINNVWTRHGLDPNIGLALAAQESNFNPNAENIPLPGKEKSSAKGLFAFTDATASDYGLDNPKNAEQSADAAARLFKDLLARTNGNVMEAIALYHGGRFKDAPDAADLQYAQDVTSRLAMTQPVHDLHSLSF